jgi:hypothetical protein
VHRKGGVRTAQKLAKNMTVAEKSSLE